MSAPPPFSLDDRGVRLAVRLTPRASRNGIDGIVVGADGRSVLRLRLMAPPVDAAANKALLAYLADGLKLRQSDISILSGEKARLKMLHFAGDGPTIAARLEAWIKAA